MSFAVIAKLICVFVFTYAKSRFSRDEAHMIEILLSEMLKPKLSFQIGNVFGRFKTFTL